MAAVRPGWEINCAERYASDTWLRRFGGLVADRDSDWVGVDAWEELTVRRQPFPGEAACMHHLQRQRAKARSEATQWRSSRCVTVQEFLLYPRSETGDFGRQRLRALGYSN